jgi:hypothetical protein
MGGRTIGSKIGEDAKANFLLLSAGVNPGQPLEEER